MNIEFSEEMALLNAKNKCNKNNINNILDTKSNGSKEIVIDSNKLTKQSKYDHSKKMDIIKKISKIKKKEYLIEIFKIITSETKDYTENNNGVFIFFHNLSDNVYDKVDSYVANIYKMHRSPINNIFNSDISESINIMSDTIEINNINKINKNLSNKEKMIMRRKKYEETIAHNNE